MMTSRPVEGARMRYFCRSLTAPDGSERPRRRSPRRTRAAVAAASGASGADGHAAVGPGDEEVGASGEPDDREDERGRPDLVDGRAGGGERLAGPGDVDRLEGEPRHREHVEGQSEAAEPD